MGICQSKNNNNLRREPLRDENSPITQGNNSQREPLQNENLPITRSENLSTAQILSSIRTEVPAFAPFQGRMEARLIGISDGDTISAIVLLYGQPTMIKIRVSGIDTPEKKGETAKYGIMATEESFKFFGVSNVYEPNSKYQTARTRKRFLEETNCIIELEFNKIEKLSDGEKFGRELAKVYYKGKSLGDYLIGKGLAKEYKGGKKNQDEWIEK